MGWRFLGREGGVPGYGGSRRGVDWGKLALSLPARREAILFARRGAVASFGGCYILECNCAFYVFASEHGCVLPLYKHADIRRGHGMEGRRRGLRVDKQLIGCVGQAT